MAMKIIKLLALAIVILTVGACSYPEKADMGEAYCDSVMDEAVLDSICVDDGADGVVEGDVDPVDDILRGGE